MPRILILFAHPRLEKSRINLQLIKDITTIPGVTFRDLYEEYPDFDVDIKAEQQLLLEHEVIVFHHPFYWYSAPPLIKQWIDLVLAHGWAYGSAGRMLEGKFWLQIITSGGPESSYQATGGARFTIREYLIPFEQTARLCKMTFLPPLAIQGTHRMTSEELGIHSRRYQKLISGLSDGSIRPEELTPFSYTKDYFESVEGK